ncbi:MAG: MEKHLA domain-containing protein [Spirulinaceae cyanobacterium]
MIEPWQNPTIIAHSQLLLNSFQHWTGQELFKVTGTPTEQAHQLFYAPFVLVSHNTEDDPIFNYGNQQALALWELNWSEFTQMPSRKTAEHTLREDRQRLLQDTAAKGFGEFAGVRISSTGKRFKIKRGLLWNVVDKESRYCGQAATYNDYEFI